MHVIQKYQLPVAHVYHNGKLPDGYVAPAIVPLSTWAYRNPHTTTVQAAKQFHREIAAQWIHSIAQRRAPAASAVLY